jgi:tetratricopeptide (TPR) repeat protein
MKHIALFFIALFISFTAAAQEKSKAEELIKEGIKLHDAAKYQEAIAKYKEALLLEPANPTLNYEIAYTIFNTSAKRDAIPYLMKVIETKNKTTVQAYDMLGSIYDIDKQQDKAIEFYNLGIREDPTYQRLYFNLAITYGGMGKNEEAMKNVAKALELNPAHASSHRVYAILAQSIPGNDIKAVLAYCNFLLLEASSERSGPAYTSLQTLLGSGVTKKEGVSNITFNNSNGDTQLGAANLAISMSLLTAQQIPNLGPTEQLELQLKNIFNIAGELSAKKTDKDFFWSYYAAYFAKLAKTEFMPVAAHVISFSANPDENKKWLNDHQQQLKDFIKWQTETTH